MADLDAAIERWGPVFEEHGFDDYDIDFSSVSAEAVEAMGIALQSVSARNNPAPDVMPGRARTFTGLRINIAAPTAAMIDARDIAHQMAQDVRYSGAGSRWYSVAEHSCLVHDACCLAIARGVPDLHSGQRMDRFGIAALFHDAPEAYIRDMPAPAKALFPGYCVAEHSLYRAIAERYDFAGVSCPVVRGDERIELIKVVDRAIRPLECAFLFGDDLPGLPSWIADLTIDGWDIERAEREFLGRFKRYDEKGKRQ